MCCTFYQRDIHVGAGLRLLYKVHGLAMCQDNEGVRLIAEDCFSGSWLPIVCTVNNLGCGLAEDIRPDSA